MAESLRTGVRSVYLPPHIVVLVHGNNGSAADFDAVEAALQAKFGERQMLIIKSRANEPDTSLGVEIGGTRLAKEVVEAVFEYDLSPVVNSYKLSVVGHSLGGLYARLVALTGCASWDVVQLRRRLTGALCALSVVQNILRLGVHKVLSSRSIYGQTGIDLLLDGELSYRAATNVVVDTGTDFNVVLCGVAAQEQQLEGVTDAHTAEPARPLLEVMSDPESEFVRSLKRFRHGTLVAMTDGDVVVPYPSASMRSYSPYVSTFLTERYMDWRWHIRHSGFCQCDDSDRSRPAYAAFLDRLNSKVDTSIEVEKHELGVDATCAPRYPSIEGFDCDNKQEVEYPHDMLCSLQQSIPWRRIDVTVEPCGMKGKMRLHDWPINKMQPPDCRADEFIDLLCDMIGADHQMRPLTTPDTVGIIHESPALALARRLRHAAKRTDGNSTSDSGADSDADAQHSGTTSPTSGSSVTSSGTNIEHFPLLV
ncbi:unnamed protein product [Phytophthora fragariaefolia]|uniref:Unnamed protein product n=1 Tax=Phytophthora fragariaefolia TaxID=1490495 RepID=A0A9W7D853_9STRA|nr:unnamed protein product [Phytophthora fragariaefolia]